MGARVKFQTLRPARWSRRTMPFTVDVKRFGRNEFFELRVEEGVDVNFKVLQIDPADRHMLLMAEEPRFNEKTGQKMTPNQSRFLVGHDERHWFAAGIGSAVSTVKAAKDSLKPTEVRELEHGVKSKSRHDRRNEVRVRQGEWFFIPDPTFVCRQETDHEERTSFERSRKQAAYLPRSSSLRRRERVRKRRINLIS